jgi:hypothetical protein
LVCRLITPLIMQVQDLLSLKHQAVKRFE